MEKQAQEADQAAPLEQNNVVNSELQEFIEIREQRRWTFPRAALVGVGAGALALLFRITLTEAGLLQSMFFTWAHQMPSIGWLFVALFTLTGAVAAVALTRRFSPESSGSGIPHLEAVLQRMRTLNWKRILPVKFVGGILGIGGGLALGREGPTVQMGGAVGAAVSSLLKISGRERLTLITAGGGAGLAAAFNAPFSGLIFVLEEMRRDFQPIVFGATLVAAVVADIIARMATGQFPVFFIPDYPTPPLASLPIFAVLGIVTGLLGVLFNKGLLFSVKFYSRVPARFKLLAAAITGGCIGLIGWFYPQLMGSGQPLAETVLNGKMMLAIIPLFFVLRFFMTTASYGTGSPGGIFTPLLVLGALIGSIVGQISYKLAPEIVPIPAVFAVVGMAAYFSAIVRAPLTGIMLIVEMTGNYSQMLPLLVSCFCAYAVAELLRDLPIYEALMERDLRLSGDISPLVEPIVEDFILQAGAPFVGREIRLLGLPPGCIIIRCSEGMRQWVPTANTRLREHMRITVVIAPEATGSIELLHKGCSGPEKQTEVKKEFH